MSARGRRSHRLALTVTGLALMALAPGCGEDGRGGAGAPGGEIVLTGPGRPAATPDMGTAPIPAAHRAANARHRALRRTLDAAVGEAAALGGAVEAAVVLDRGPALTAAAPGDPERPMRAWSMSKVLTAVALLRANGWGARPGRALSAEADAALEGALVRSENCRQRRVVLELQRAFGGPEGALAALREIADIAGARVTTPGPPEPPEPICHDFLDGQRELAEPRAPGLLLGTSTWTVASAARLAHALGDGRFGAALGDRVLGLLRAPKLRSREAPPGDYTAALDWGAGRALAGLRPAYKAGWGGTLQGSFLAGQLAVVELPGGGVAGIAVAFHPDAQPPKDDPGLTAGPAAVEAVMSAVGAVLRDAATRR